MRALVLASLLVACALGSAADPPPLLKPVAPGGDAARLRFAALVPKDQPADAVFKARIAKPKGKKGEYTDVTLVVTSLSAPTHSIQQWKAWGLEVTADRVGVLPELVLTGAQTNAPKTAKGRDAEYRVTNLKVPLYEAPGGEKGGVTNVLTIPFSALAGAGETRFHVGDAFLEFTARGARKLATSDQPLGEVAVSSDAKLKAATVPMTGPAFNYVSVNGFTQYQRPNGTPERVVGVLSIGDGGSDITMSVTMARGCGAQLDKEAGATSATVKELRLGPTTGPDLKGQRDFVLRDVTVSINSDESQSVVWFGTGFVAKHFKDGIYAQDPNGAWKLHGRVKPEETDDIKTRLVPKVPKKP